MELDMFSNFRGILLAAMIIGLAGCSGSGKNHDQDDLSDTDATQGDTDDSSGEDTRGDGSTDLDASDEDQRGGHGGRWRR